MLQNSIWLIPNQMSLAAMFLLKRSHRFLLIMAPDEQWYENFRRCVHEANKGNGCIHCSTGNCYTAFGDSDGEDELRQWHRQWSIMSLVGQAVKLLGILQ